jgi:hypothetical protein
MIKKTLKSKFNFKPMRNNDQKTLKFIHITKTGGTSIEEEGKLHDQKWGMYHKEYGFWHTIPNKFSLMNKYDWFMVVRNPYDRIISEFHCKWGGVYNNASKYNKNQFNNYIRQKIINRIASGGHYTEQYKYYFSKNIHVLKFENLKKEFDDLMKKYKLNIKLNIHTNTNNKFFTIKDFDEETIKLINDVYYKDFVTFNYKFLYK